MNQDDVEYLKFKLDEYLQDAQLLYDNMRAEGLTFGSIESEGALRIIKTLHNDIYWILENEHSRTI